MAKLEISRSGRLKLKMHDPKAFVRSLHLSFRQCRKMEKDGSSKAAIGWVFYKTMCELFGEDYAASPMTDTAKKPLIHKPPTANPPA